ncbi:PaaI family thioesterase [Novosphingobium lentum]|uniref:PaaI family thioesterase n=1 Tax=Novosphingobium lentum TaxID=145287 RepID=UPI000AA24586|nr:PaaI family thioesterase [Novosphingobium lentum]
MTDGQQQHPPIAGDWQAGEVTATGPWTVGQLSIDWATHRYALCIEERHCNATGVMNGGAMATFLDGQAFVVINDKLHDYHRPTISLSVDLLAPTLVGDWLVAEVTLVKITRSMIVTQALAKVGDRVVARSNAIYSNTQRKDAP